VPRPSHIWLERGVKPSPQLPDSKYATLWQLMHILPARLVHDSSVHTTSSSRSRCALHLRILKCWQARSYSELIMIKLMRNSCQLLLRQ
jgi:hypothetical protein